jgi:hypothetical protein
LQELLFDNRLDVWSYGGGVQTVALAALIKQGKIRRPDLVIMADTGREKSSTFDYLHEIIEPELAEIGLSVEIVKAEQYATVGLFSRNGLLLMPAFTTFNDKIGKLPTFCSNEWKTRVIHRRLTELGIDSVRMWLGISTDEAHRMKDSKLNWIENYYPLCDLEVSRAECVEIINSMGWPLPKKSSCYDCPNMTDAEWLEVKTEAPHDFQKAIEEEQQVRAVDGSIYFHKSGVTLDQAIFNPADKREKFDGCDSGICWT